MIDYKMNIRLINTTTNLPVDEELEKIFKKTIHSAYGQAIQTAHNRINLKYVDVFFVNSDDLDLERRLERKRIEGGDEHSLDQRRIEDDEINEREEGIDLLGAYIRQHPELGRPVIKISPEKVMKACLSYNEARANPLPLVDIYPTLLVAVIIHELAHFFMDHEAKRSHDDIPLNWLVDRLQDDPHYDLDRNHRYHHHYRAPHPIWANLRRFIEESLANAFILKQNITEQERIFLQDFTSTQPQGYRQGSLWSGNLELTLKTAITWAHFKSEFEYQRLNFVFEEENIPAKYLVDRLLSGMDVELIDFMNIFHEHLERHVPAWQAQYQENNRDWNERLNGTFGIYWKITKFRKISTSSRLIFLTQWAANGSPDGVDELYKTLAESAKENGDYFEAIQHQRDRLIHLPNLNINDYWRDRFTTEMNSSIAELEALLANQHVDFA